jgi:hypothetical protein
MMSRRGIALPLVLGVVLCFSVWIVSLSWTMSQSRHRFRQMIKIRRAYFLGRSALQHFFLKVKVFQRNHPNAMQTLYSASPSDWEVLSRSFVQDIIIPDEKTGSFSGKYSIASFTIETLDRDSPNMAIRITAVGNAEGVGELIHRTYKVSR